MVENEIRVKLFYLEMIHKLREGSGVRKADEVSTLVLRIKDMKDKILIKSGEEPGIELTCVGDLLQDPEEKKIIDAQELLEN